MPSSPQYGGSAWYDATREQFVAQAAEAVAGTMASAANRGGWAIEPDQQEEWERSVDLLQERLRGGRTKAAAIDTLRAALDRAEAQEVTDVVLEYDLRRRGLRIDSVLLAPGAILVLEFKRSRLGAAARDQVVDYGTSLVEFHAETRRLVERGTVVVPILVRTRGHRETPAPSPRWARAPFQQVLAEPLRCDGEHLGETIRHALSLRTTPIPICRESWLNADFSPSSTILDAAISLYGDHDVSAIRAHAAPAAEIRACTETVRREVTAALGAGERRIVFVSGAPGAGKTLVGLDLAFDPSLRQDAVFVTGNAPLVDVLNRALKSSYKRNPRRGSLVVRSGYAKEHVRGVLERSTFKLEKAHRFLGERGARTGSSEGAVLVFDEAQRTYEKGKRVANRALESHEADLILQALEHSYVAGAAVVALLGQNQAINRSERGAMARFEAADRRGWPFAVSDETLDLPEFAGDDRWRNHPLRRPLPHGHLSHSMRYYRNAGLERWAHHVMEDQVEPARRVAERLHTSGDTIWMTRDLDEARAWARRARVGEERAGLIASSQARRLAAFGLHVDLKPDIAAWMLAPSDDFRSSNMLETVQNQYQIQGLEIDWAVVCWGADLRREDGRWSSHRISGGRWQRDRALDIARNGYRVLLTRARKGMVLFIPHGDRTGEDPTRDPAFYDRTADHLLRCGARPLEP